MPEDLLNSGNAAEQATRSPLHIAVACGGTGGHIFPGLATAERLRSRGHRVTLWLAGRAIEQRTISDWDGAVMRSGARPLRLATLPTLGRSLLRCWRELAGSRYDLLLAMGSYSSLPPVLAAAMRRLPIVLHEANAIPGRAVSQLARFATATAVNFAQSGEWLPQAKRIVTTGLPLRRGLAEAAPLAGFRRQNGFTVLITGGSQGAHALNQLSVAALTQLAHSGSFDDLRVIHQSGAADAATLRAQYTAAAIDAQVFDFLPEMGRAYATADLAICRAGAATCAEIALCGPPTLFVPLPSAVRDHQSANARQLVEGGGADMRPQSELSAQWLADYIARMRSDSERRALMRAKLRELAIADGDQRLANLIEELAAIR